MLMTKQAIERRKYQKARAAAIKAGTWKGSGKAKRAKATEAGEADVKSAIIYLRKYQRKMEGLDGKDLLAMLALEALQGAI